jgi:hypothetical protein
MPIVATFYQLADDEIELFAPGLGSPTSKTLGQSITVTPTGGEGALVSWVARRNAAGSVTYTVTLNSTQIGTYITSSEERITIQEAVDANDVKKGDNDLVFAVTAGPSSLKLGDVMLWHRVSVD